MRRHRTKRFPITATVVAAFALLVWWALPDEARLEDHAVRIADIQTNDFRSVWLNGDEILVIRVDEPSRPGRSVNSNAKYSVFRPRNSDWLVEETVRHEPKPMP